MMDTESGDGIRPGGARGTKILVAAAIGLGLGLIVAAIVIAASGGDERPAATAAPASSAPLEIADDSPVAGDHLVSGRPIDGELTLSVPLRTFTFTGERGDAVTISLMAQDSDLDSRLLLVGPAGDEIGSDDDSGDGLDALLEAQLPDPGTYRLHAYCYSLTRCGAYRLEFTYTPAR